jgi:hypothetical protein
MTRDRARRLPLLLLVLGLFSTDPVHGQDVTVRGQVLGPDRAPLPDHRVLLHRVDSEGGATIAETLSDAEGRFELRAEASPDTAAVYFVASRYDGELFIGPMFRAAEASLEQVIQVGVPETSATALMEGELPPRQVGRPATTRNWLLLLIPLLGVIGVAVYALLPRGRIPPQRAALIRVAELDERLETAPPAQRSSLLEERRHLIAQLRAD